MHGGKILVLICNQHLQFADWRYFFLFMCCTRVTPFFISPRWSKDWIFFNRNSRDLCASQNLAGCTVSKICSKTLPSDNILFDYHHGLPWQLSRSPLQAIEACEAVLTLSPHPEMVSLWLMHAHFQLPFLFECAATVQRARVPFFFHLWWVSRL